MAIRFDITEEKDFFIGTDQPIQVDVKQSDETTAQTMTGFALTWELKDAADGVVRISKTVGSGITIEDDGDGNTDARATIAVDDTDTEPLPPGRYYHQLRRTDTGLERVLSYGDVDLLESGL